MTKTRKPKFTPSTTEVLILAKSAQGQATVNTPIIVQSVLHGWRPSMNDRGRWTQECPIYRVTELMTGESYPAAESSIRRPVTHDAVDAANDAALIDSAMVELDHFLPG